MCRSKRTSDGDPTGILRGNVTNYYNRDPFFAELHAKMPPIVDPELAIARRDRGTWPSTTGMGITTLYEAHAMTFELLGAYQALRANNLLSVRVKGAAELQPSAMIDDPELSPEQIRETLEQALAMTELNDEWLRFDGITTCTFGPCNSGFLYWPEGYKDAFGRTATGRRMVSPETNRMAFEFCAEHGLRLNLCAVSPAEIDEHLAMTDEVMAKYGLDRTGWVLQHGFLVREDQAKALAERGFDMTVSMSFTFGKGDTVAERFPADALPLLNPLRHLIDAGLAARGRYGLGPEESLGTNAIGADPQAVSERVEQRRPGPGDHSRRGVRHVDSQRREGHPVGGYRRAGTGQPCRYRHYRPQSHHLRSRRLA